MPLTSADIRDAAVVDVGSNSVRLVIHRLEGRAIWTVFNEKVLAGLGRGVQATGTLSPEGVVEALSALRRFKAVLDAAKPDVVFAVATAAARDAADGPAFLQRVREEIGLDVRVLTGAEEARYSAMGVAAGCPHARGVAADLGGSSLELIRVGPQGPGEGVSLPLGPFALGAPKPMSPAALRKRVLDRLRGAEGDFRDDTLHAVGGAWRNLALIHMRHTGHPLQIVHQYEMTADQALSLLPLVAKLSRTSLERLPGVSKKRIDTLPYAAVVLQCLIERLGFSRLVFSAYGLREGLLYEAMDEEVRARDPLIEGCGSLGARQGVAEGLGFALAAWLKPAFDSLDPVFDDGRDGVLVSAASRLADLGARLHPDHRADLAFAQVMRAPIAGQTHAERAFLAVAVHARYGGSAQTPEPGLLGRVLTSERFDRARALGLAMRLGCDLSARSAALLEKSSLVFTDDAVEVGAEPDWADMLLGEQTAKRAGALASALELDLRMRAAAG